MPELPEVETVKNDLKNLVEGDQILFVKVLNPCNLKDIAEKDFKNILKGKKIKTISRLGKSLKFSLNSGYAMLVHLKMTGRFYAPQVIDSLDSHTHIIFKMKKTGWLAFSDIRKFGVVYVKRDIDLKRLPYLQNLGVDPTGSFYKLDLFKKLVNKHGRKNLKVFLLDQSIVSGIGNIYASEILFKSGLNPLRAVGSLNLREIKLLFENIRLILRKAIKYRGTTSDNFKDVSGAQGGFQSLLKVYARADESCSVCAKKIERIVQNGRSTFYCTLCQS